MNASANDNNVALNTDDNEYTLLVNMRLKLENRRVNKEIHELRMENIRLHNRIKDVTNDFNSSLESMVRHFNTRLNSIINGKESEYTNNEYNDNGNATNNNGNLGDKAKRVTFALPDQKALQYQDTGNPCSESQMDSKQVYAYQSTRGWGHMPNTRKPTSAKDLGKMRETIENQAAVNKSKQEVLANEKTIQYERSPCPIIKTPTYSDIANRALKTDCQAEEEIEKRRRAKEILHKKPKVKVTDYTSIENLRLLYFKVQRQPIGKIRDAFKSIGINNAAILNIDFIGGGIMEVLTNVDTSASLVEAMESLQLKAIPLQIDDPRNFKKLDKALEDERLHIILNRLDKIISNTNKPLVKKFYRSLYNNYKNKLHAYLGIHNDIAVKEKISDEAHELCPDTPLDLSGVRSEMNGLTTSDDPINTQSMIPAMGDHVEISTASGVLDSATTTHAAPRMHKDDILYNNDILLSIGTTAHLQDSSDDEPKGLSRHD